MSNSIILSNIDRSLISDLNVKIQSIGRIRAGLTRPTMSIRIIFKNITMNIIKTIPIRISKITETSKISTAITTREENLTTSDKVKTSITINKKDISAITSNRGIWSTISRVKMEKIRKDEIYMINSKVNNMKIPRRLFIIGRNIDDLRGSVFGATFIWAYFSFNVKNYESKFCLIKS